MWLEVLVERVGAARLTSVNDAWAESWITRIEREQHLGPATIRHHVGLARGNDIAPFSAVRAGL